MLITRIRRGWSPKPFGNDVEQFATSTVSHMVAQALNLRQGTPVSRADLGQPDECRIVHDFEGRTIEFPSISITKDEEAA